MLRDPTHAEIADCLGFNQKVDVDESHVRDVVIVGAGPAGLGAAVYAASEGLDCRSRTSPRLPGRACSIAVAFVHQVLRE